MSDLPEFLRGRLAPILPVIHIETESRPAAVLVPLYHDKNMWHILYTRRTETVEDHRGQVSFPGGVIEAYDETAKTAALREATEEIGIHEEDVEILGVLEPHATVTNFVILPVVGIIPWPYPLSLNQEEVAVAFGVPLRWLTNPDNLEIRYWKIQPQSRGEAVHFFKSYENEVIWGATARITLSLLELLKEFHE